MDELPDWAPRNIDLTTPSAARVYDYFLGGAHNFAPDREMARRILDLHPTAEANAQANRAFLHRAVRHLVQQGVRQFIDLGSGIPTVGNVHEVAQREAPDARVVYVDIDPIAVAHSQLILDGVRNAAVVNADLRRPKEVLAAPQLAGLIDFSEPVAFLMVAVLHFIPESDRPEDTIAELHAVAAPGSYLVISHGYDARLDAVGAGAAPPAEQLAGEGKEVLGVYRRADPITVRTRPRIEQLFEGWPLVEPGLVWVPQWHPDWPDGVGTDPSSSYVLAGMGRKADA
ncbi:SAM-dependent methyltransferase [Kineosporia sp. J2-2]|uniref:SAM-dependent methyltransferase n=1 Tax=Kineosporia corallincola TaxID=2835133 RepID=A0ABS5TDH4_9ACTN|nr:SAM-dependent methyltransferase [Kineosporia corallincola]MBT0769137.1 SAM-dependent methyltransferase [Kineosporia corallincola]